MDKLDVYKEKGKIVISKKSKFLGVIFLTRNQTEELYEKLGDMLGRIDYKREMEKDKNKFI